jgi:phosphoserine phosphatase
VDCVVDKISLDGGLGTPLERINGIYTGKIVPPLIVGEMKATRMDEYLQANNIDVTKNDLYMYTDSVVDLPVLESVGHPIVVYPDDDLYQIAVNRSWPILS